MISMESAFSGFSEEEAGERLRRLIAAVRALPGFHGHRRCRSQAGR